MDTADIEGAQPRKRFVIARGPGAKDEPIEGARPRPHPRVRFDNKPDSFNVRDIDGAKPRTSMFRTRRRLDPLDPQYVLPSFEPLTYEDPRFIRDSINVDDIEGTKPRVKRQFAPRDSHNVDDIEGTNAAWKPHRARVLEMLRAQSGSRKADSLDVSDIIRVGFVSQRCSDPLRPIYRVNGMEHRDCPIRSVPRRAKPERAEPFFSLHTHDIRGAKGGSASVFQRLRVAERTEFRNTNQTDDIAGAQTGTLRRGLRSKRCTDPLKPRYRFLHGCETPTPPTDQPDLLRSLAHHRHPKLDSGGDAFHDDDDEADRVWADTSRSRGFEAAPRQRSSNQDDCDSGGDDELAQDGANASGRLKPSGRSASSQTARTARSGSARPATAHKDRESARQMYYGPGDSARSVASAKRVSSARRARPDEAPGGLSGRSKTRPMSAFPLQGGNRRPQVPPLRTPMAVRMAMQKQADIEAVKELPSW